MLKGLHANIYGNLRWQQEGSDTSAGGLSSRVTGVTVIDDRVEQVFEASDDYPPVKLRHVHIGMDAPICAVPIIPDDLPMRDWWQRRTHFMMGGTFIHTSDSRFPASYPIPLHDRSESRHNYWLAYQIWTSLSSELIPWMELSGQRTRVIDIQRFRVRLFAFYVRFAHHGMKTVTDVLVAWRDYMTQIEAVQSDKFVIAPSREHQVTKLVKMDERDGRTDYFLQIRYRIGKRILETKYCSPTIEAVYALAYQDMREALKEDWHDE